MLKRTITHADTNGNEITKDYWFHLTKVEVLELQIMDDIEAVYSSNDPQRIIPTLKKIIRYSVGERFGDDFEKSERFANRFISSDAYSELLMKMLFENKNAEEAVVEFFRGILPVEAQFTQPPSREVVSEVQDPKKK